MGLESLRNRANLIILILILIGIISLSISNFKKISYYADISKGDFEIHYTMHYGFKGYNIQMQILSNGYYIKNKTNLYDESQEIEEGYYLKDDIVSFVKYAVKNNIYKMSDKMNANVEDGQDVFFDIRIGKKNIKVGGYQPQHVSRDFENILIRFESIIYK